MNPHSIVYTSIGNSGAGKSTFIEGSMGLVDSIIGAIMHQEEHTLYPKVVLIRAYSGAPSKRHASTPEVVDLVSTFLHGSSALKQGSIGLVIDQDFDKIPTLLRRLQASHGVAARAPTDLNPTSSRSETAIIIVSRRLPGPRHCAHQKSVLHGPIEMLSLHLQTVGGFTYYHVPNDLHHHWPLLSNFVITGE
jgi:hypothetical protein